MNSIFDRAIELALENGGDLKVIDYVVGTGMTSVKLSNGNVGIAHLFREELPTGCSLFEELLDTPVDLTNFTELAKHFNPICVSLAMAAVNAVLNYSTVTDNNTGDIFKILKISPEDRVGFVGDFRPLTSKLEGNVKELHIFERHARHNYLPDWAAPWKLGECDVVVLTGTTIMNRTIDNLLKYINTDRTVVFGPSTVMDLELYPSKVMAIGGASIIDPEKAMKITARAGGTKNIYKEKAAMKITIIR